MIKKLLLPILFAGLGVAAMAAPVPSILHIKNSITDNNIVPPASFETQTRQLEENFYIKNFVVPGVDTGVGMTATPKEYEQRLSKLPTVIEMPYNSIVKQYIEMYITKRRGLVADMLALHNYYGRFFEEELLKQGMPVELEYLPVIESALNPNAVSPAGAEGLWQFMPATAKGLGMEVNSLVDERRDPRLSSKNAARYLKQLYDIYKDWSLAIAAYNCGPGNVNKALRRAGGESGGKKDFWEIYPYLPAETRGYVPAFIAANYVMNYYKQHGITPTIVKRQLTTDTVVVNKYLHFNQIAAVLNIPVEEIRMLNPQFRKDIIPGDYRPYALTLPTQQCLSYIMSEKRIQEYDRELYARRTTAEPANPGGAVQTVVEIVNDNGEANLANAEKQSSNAQVNNALAQTVVAERSVTKTHVVARGESIRDIARKYGVSATDIKRWNQLRRGKVKEGDKLTLEVVERTNPADVKVVASQEVAQRVEPKSDPKAQQGDVPTAPKKQTKPAAEPVPAAPKKQTKPATEPKPEPVEVAEATPAAKKSVDSAATIPPKKETATAAKKGAKQSAEEERPMTRAERAKAKKEAEQKSKAKQKSHTVKGGESLYHLAQVYGTSVEEIQKANGMKAGDTNLQIGQEIKLPSKAKGASTSKSSSSKKSSGKKKRR